MNEPDETEDAPKLYISPQMPDQWVTEHEGVLVYWPAMDEGWAQRAPYVGHRRALIEVKRYNAYGTGWPYARGFVH